MTSGPDIYAAYESMERDRVILLFKGQITHELLSSIYQIIETRLADLNENEKRRKKVYNVLVESLQNVYNHMDELQGTDANEEIRNRDSMFMIVRNDDGSYCIHTGNFILNSRCEILEEKILKVNAMSAEEIRSHYVEKLNTSEFSEKGGAGLGIIDIARKSGNKLGFRFHQINDKYSFFSLVVRID